MTENLQNVHGYGSSDVRMPDSNQCQTVADLMVYYLESIGIEYIFGIPGGAIEPLYDAVARSSRRGGMRMVGARHEAAAAYMADGYHRETGKLGVCLATSGPGATNLITGVACAYDNHIPMLVITGQPAIPSFGKGALQESSCTGVNVIGMMLHCTRYNTLISHPAQLESKLTQAIYKANQSPAGPVHISVPVDILRARLPATPQFYGISKHLYWQNYSVNEATIEECFKLLSNDNAPVFFIGRNAETAIDGIMQLVAVTGARFITTPDAKGLVDARHKSYRGVFGLGGHASAALQLQNHDSLIFAFGSDFGEFFSAAWSPALMNSRLVHIDQNPDHLAQTPMSKLHVWGNMCMICERLLKRFNTDKGIVKTVGGDIYQEMNPGVILESIDQYFSEDTPIKPQRLMKELSERFPFETRFVVDAGNSMMWAPHYLQPVIKTAGRLQNKSLDGICGRGQPFNWLRMALNFAPMGWALGAAIGMARANTRSPVVCITGDGAYMMSGQEITVAVQEQLPVIIVVLNDSVYGMVMHGQRLSGAEQTGYELPVVNFAQQAEALGVENKIIESPVDFNQLADGCLVHRTSPLVLDVRIDREQIPPMIMRLQALGSIERNFGK